MEQQMLDKDALQELGADVVTPEADNWDQARQAWNLAAVQNPSAVIYAENVDDVSEAINFARENGLGIAAGHRPRRRLARPARRLDPAQDRAHEGDRGRRVQPGRPLRGGSRLDGGQPRRRRAWPRQPLRLGTRHRHRRLPRPVAASVGSRASTALPATASARSSWSPTASSGGSTRQRTRPLLGDPRGRRQLRRRDRDRVRPGRDAGGVRRRRPLSGRR